MSESSICLAITGASGFPYALKLLQQLLAQAKVHLLVSDAARQVAICENSLELSDDLAILKKQLLEACDATQYADKLFLYAKTDWHSPVASGSSNVSAMVICPCSTGTLAAVAAGMSNNLIERAATVMLKERRQLVVVPREMPLSAIQLEAMHKLALLGVAVLPASPGFYQKPQSVDDMVDFVVARILQQLNLPHALVKPWGE